MQPKVWREAVDHRTTFHIDKLSGFTITFLFFYHISLCLNNFALLSFGNVLLNDEIYLLPHFGIVMNG